MCICVRSKDAQKQLARTSLNHSASTPGFEVCYLFSDDLPLRGFIGHLEEGGFLPHMHKVFLWAHLHFNIAYNGDQVHGIVQYYVGECGFYIVGISTQLYS